MQRNAQGRGTGSADAAIHESRSAAEARSLMAASMDPPRAFCIRDARWIDDGDALKHVRRVVFIDEQKVPEALEWDDDDPLSLHALGIDADQRPIATGRLLPDGHIGR